ncbi:receptor-type tyrosine-protein phosphatase F-like isoform X2 [Amphiura filiformis]|uniref:receptor-type tyrosine-protein phosphatase F-like isoform X2 n=1 Tax=Amphiura filiformis TaxID=82378 RepID=UPI003B224DF2
MAQSNTRQWRGILVISVLFYCWTINAVKAAPPVITQELQDESGLEDQPIAFICKASGNPAPTFEWMKGNKRASNSRYTIMPIPDGSILWIEPLKPPRDNSEYSCIASNSEGSATTSANLNVYPSSSVPRSFPEITVAPRVSVVEKHRQAVMSCAATGNPDPDILWFVNMIPVDTSNDRVHISDSSTLTIDNADETDQGKYQCAASNSAGTRYSDAANLYVRERRVPPRFTIEPSNMEVVPGGSVNLTCVAVGSPMPMVKWTHGGMDLNTGELPIGRNVLQLANVEETGEYTCVAMSKLGTIQTSVTITVRTRPGAPAPPNFVSATATSATVRWNFESDEPIQSYVLQYKLQRSSGSYNETRRISETEYTINGLLPFTNYAVRVAAVNSIGQGEPSNDLVITTGETAPGSAPRDVRASPLSSSTILIQWEPPDVPNGIVTGYNVYYTMNPGADLSSWFKYTVEDNNQRLTTISELVTMQIYSVSVSASTAEGEGPASFPVQVKTQQGVPSQPENFAGDSTSATQIKLTWGQRDIEVQIQYYDLYYNDSKTGKAVHRSVAPTRSYTLEDLKPNTVYNLWLAAKSRAGQGASTAVISVRTQESVPGAPPRDVIGTTLSSISIQVNWNPPPEDFQNGIITGYKLIYERDSNGDSGDDEESLLQEDGPMEISVGPRVTSYTLNDLNKWTEYDISVLASTAVGDGPASDPVKIRTDEDVPDGPPKKVRVEALNSTTLRIRWQPPAEHRQHGDIRGYQVHYSVSNQHGDYIGEGKVYWVTLANMREIILYDLTPKTWYSIEIAAYTVKGDGIRSRAKLVQTPGQVPGAPTDVSVEMQPNGAYLVRWSSPVATHGDILQYRIEYYPNIAPDRMLYMEFDSTISFCQVEDLTHGMGYTFEVKARNSEGFGLPAEQQVTTPEGKPKGAPTNVMAKHETDTNSITVTWDQPELMERNGVITKYMVLYYTETNPGEDISEETTDTKLVVMNPYPVTQYIFQVRAYTAVGNGPYSTQVHIMTPPEPPQNPPIQVTAVVMNGTAVRVHWKPPHDFQDHMSGLGYIIYNIPSANMHRDYKTWPNTHIGDFDRYDLSGLRELTEYAIIVVLRTPQGRSPPSTVVRVTTGSAEPSSPRNFQARVEGRTEVRLQWDPPASLELPVIGYVIKYSTSREARTERPQYVDAGQQWDIDQNQHSLVIAHQLKPNMEYEFDIRARTKSGLSPPAIIYVRTKIAAPEAVEEPIIDPTTVSETSIKLKLPRVTGHSGPVDNVFIVVVPLLTDNNGRPIIPDKPTDSYSLSDLTSSDRSRRDVSDRREQRATEAESPYISAQLRGNNMPPNFVIGDGAVYNGYYNKPLEKGKYYSFFTRVTVMSEDEEPLTKSSRYTRAVKAEKPPKGQSTSSPSNPDQQSGKGGSSLTTIIAAVVGIVLVSIIAVLIVLFVCRKRNGNGDPGPKRKEEVLPNPTDPVEMRRMTYQTPAMMSHPPIPIAELGEHIDRLKANDNLLFSQEYESIEPGQQFTWDHSNLEVNKPKNRYANVIAYDHSRVILTTIDGIPGSDYINANYCDGYRKQNAYIATQGPLPETISDFWRTVWEQRTSTIVMMTKLEERNRVKCDQYWPSRGQETYGQVQVTLLDITELATYTVRTFALVNLKNRSQEKREVRQFQFTAWPDHGVPEHSSSVLAFVHRVKACNPADAGPVVVHCSAGVGRAGAYIVIDSMLERIKHEKTVDIYGHVTCLRAQRNYMVQTEEQYIFIHEALLDAVISGNTEVLARNLYAHIQKLTQLEPNETITAMESEFKRLANQKALPSKFVSANLPANKFKNRLVNILPYESTRVCLQPIRGVEGSDYINASCIDGYRSRNAYIATQGPLAETTEDFWRMLWEQNSTIIVMLTKLREMGREKCHQYWPAERSARYQYFVVDPMSEYNMPQYILREFKVTDARDGQSRTIRQFQFTDWPEQGVPKSGEGFIDFIGQVHKTKEQFGQDGPITAHCSAGVGRTGVFITLSIVLERMRYEGAVDMFQTVKMLRTQRPAMVQTEDQYQFCYRAALEYLGSFDHYT